MREYLSAQIPRFSLISIFGNVNWTIFILVTILGLMGVMILYSAAGGQFTPWAEQHALRLGIGLILMIGIGAINIRFWYQTAYFAYASILFFLISIEIFGSSAMGARRWLDLEIFTLQPSEFMRIGLILALARYYHGIPQYKVSKPFHTLLPLLLIAIPCFLVLRQPDLGTMVLLAVCGISVMFLAGLNIRYFIAGLVALVVMVPTAWSFLHDYQKERWLTFLNPERDPLGAGYHIIQSKIGIGSGGLLGRGLTEGTQARLNFLPENHTDFIFTIIAEEMGFVGSLIVLSLYLFLLIAIFMLTRRVRGHFSRLLAGGLGVTLFAYVAVNLSMAMGLAPVVGVPLPFISYGGTSLITFLISMGLLLNIDKHSSVDIPRT